VCVACLKYSVLIFIEKIYKMQYLEGSGTQYRNTGTYAVDGVPKDPAQVGI
jgi:hypothetical protein